MVITKNKKKWIFIVFIFSSLIYGEARQSRFGKKGRTRMMTEGFKVLNGQYSLKYQSLAMFMTGDELYEFYYAADSILITPQCFLTAANPITASNDIANDNYTVMVPRAGCDRIYHLDKVYLSDPTYSEDLAANDIAVAKTKYPVLFGDSCQGPPVAPSWISCDPNGPTSGFSGCYATSFGNAETDYYFYDYYWTAGDLVTPNQTPVTILAPDDCVGNDTVPYDINNQICAQTTDGYNVKCDYDENPILFCDYWNAPVSTPSASGGGWNSNSGGGGWNSNAGGGGWNSNTGGWNSNSVGGGWKIPNSKYSAKKGDKGSSGWSSNDINVKYENRLAVGHWVHSYNEDDDDTSDYCRGSPGADLFIKYGSPTYANLFSKCGLVCSNALKRGYKCLEDPPSSLGPVYCTPVRADSHQKPNSNGWKSQL